MTKPREIAERLYASLHGHMVTPTLEGRDLNRITATLESYGSACRNAALEEAAESIERYMRLDKYASQHEHRGLLVNAPAIIRALKETKEKS